MPTATRFATCDDVTGVELLDQVSASVKLPALVVEPQRSTLILCTGIHI